MLEKDAAYAYAYAKKVYEACDTMDALAFAHFLTPGCKFVYANAEPVVGRENAAESVRKFMGMIGAIRHELIKVWREDDIIISRMTVTYWRKDGSTITVPAMTSWRLVGEEIDEYLIYVDVSPLFSQT